MPKRRRSEEEDEAERKERLSYVGVLAAGLVHEIKTPLHAIQLTVQMLVEDAERLPPDVRPRFDRRCRRVYTEVKSLSQMLDAFLSFARPPRIDPTPTDLNMMVRDIIEFARPEMDAAGIVIVSNLADDMFPVVIDKSQFTHVVLNLLKNARESIEALREKKADDFEGHIVIATAEDEDGIKLIIDDDGEGIAPGNEDRIFDLFYTTKAKGNGLGLGIVKRTVEEHRGAIRAIPKEGEGARFVVTLPRGHFLEYEGD